MANWQKELQKYFDKVYPELSIERKRRNRNAQLLAKMGKVRASKFMVQFLSKYSELTSGKYVLENIYDCYGFYHGKSSVSISEFEKMTGITLDLVSLEERYQIGL